MAGHGSTSFDFQYITSEILRMWTDCGEREKLIDHCNSLRTEILVAASGLVCLSGMNSHGESALLTQVCSVCLAALLCDG